MQRRKPPFLLLSKQNFEPATVHPPPPRPELKISDETIHFCREAKMKNDWLKQWEEEKLKAEEKMKAASKDFSLIDRGHLRS
ncbi:hypothetical protein GC174_01340 [bacterium]|nr:hypothetical protein [bacterium]